MSLTVYIRAFSLLIASTSSLLLLFYTRYVTLTNRNTAKVVATDELHDGTFIQNRPDMTVFSSPGPYLTLGKGMSVDVYCCCAKIKTGNKKTETLKH